ncbi:hypothetical protein DSF71_13650 [Salmonella enterica subsp. enterica serovar Hvittingfoss]|nr:hypothetical protein [Salmonella enterica subsp. enterica serovar Hvittingfoss]
MTAAKEIKHNQYGIVLGILDRDSVFKQNAMDRIKSVSDGMNGIAEESGATNERLTSYINTLHNLHHRLRNKCSKDNGSGEKRYYRYLIILTDELIHEMTDLQNHVCATRRALDYSAISLRINELRIRQYQWSSAMCASVLRGGMPAGQISPAEEWYNSNGKASFAHLRNFTRLGIALNGLNTVTGRLNATDPCKVSAQTLTEILQDFENASESVAAILGELDEQVMRMANYACLCE